MYESFPLWLVGFEVSNRPLRLKNRELILPCSRMSNVAVDEAGPWVLCFRKTVLVSAAGSVVCFSIADCEACGSRILSALLLPSDIDTQFLDICTKNILKGRLFC